MGPAAFSPVSKPQVEGNQGVIYQKKVYISDLYFIKIHLVYLCYSKDIWVKIVKSLQIDQKSLKLSSN